MVATYVEAVRPARPLAENETQTAEGGIAFKADEWARLRRFVVLGSDGGTYYADAKELTAENVGGVRACLDVDGARAVAEVVAVSEAGRAPKNEPAILALAMASVHPDAATRSAAFAALPRVCRTGTHLLHFAAYRKALGGGWGRGVRTAIGRWFNDRPARDLAYQAVKYKQRDGWALSDLLRLAHPVPADAEHGAIYKWIVDGIVLDGDDSLDALKAWAPLPVLIRAVELLPRVREEDRARVAAEQIREHRIPREAVPSELLNDPGVWAALLDDMPMTALIRNLGKMSSVGLLVAGSDAERIVVERVTDGDRLKKARAHPINLLAALKVYEQGHGVKGSLTWTPCKKVVNALDEAFYLAFGAVPSTGKRIRLALDVSGSMGTGVNGMPFLSAREASAAMALVTLAREPNAHVLAYSHKLVGVPLRPSMRLDEVLRVVDRIPFGGTYCSLPIFDALVSGTSVDLFCSYTDNETWDGGYRSPHTLFGGEQPPSKTASECLHEYRQRFGIEARHVVCAMAANEVSIADPTDPGQLDVAGFDSATPQLIADFAAGVV